MPLGSRHASNQSLHSSMNMDELFQDDDIHSWENPSRDFAASHPLGKLILDLTCQTRKLQKKAGIIPDELQLQEICEAFHKGMLLERSTATEAMRATTEDIEANILKREMNNYHNLNAVVKSPVKYSDTYQLINPDKVKLAAQLFPYTKQSLKFSGKRDGVSVLEWLSSLTNAQAVVLLHKEEFKDALLKSTAGPVYTLVQNYISYQYDVPDIYASLIMLYDNRLSPAEAKKQLAAYKATKNSNLTRVQSQIMDLASRVASSLPEGPSRTNCYDFEACNALIQGLPHNSSVMVSNLYNKLSAKLGKAPTYCELCKALTKFHDTITQDIKQFGAHPRQPQEARPDPRGRPATFNMNSKKDSHNPRAPRTRTQSYPASPPPTVHMSSSNRFQSSRNYAPPMRNRPSFPARSGRVHALAQRTYNRPNNNYRADGNRSGNGFRRNFQTNQGAPYNQNKGFNGRKYCVLCSASNHYANEGCKMMVDDNGVRRYVIPSYAKCKECFEKTNKSLYHPAEYCLLRPAFPKRSSLQRRD